MQLDAQALRSMKPALRIGPGRGEERAVDGGTHLVLCSYLCTRGQPQLATHVAAPREKETTARQCSAVSLPRCQLLNR